MCNTLQPHGSDVLVDNCILPGLTSWFLALQQSPTREAAAAAAIEEEELKKQQLQRSMEISQFLAACSNEEKHLKQHQCGGGLVEGAALIPLPTSSISTQQFQQQQYGSGFEDALGPFTPTTPQFQQQCVSLEDALIPLPPRTQQFQQQQCGTLEGALIPLPPPRLQQFQQQQQPPQGGTLLENAIIPLPPNITRHTPSSSMDDCYFAGLPTDLFASEDDNIVVDAIKESRKENNFGMGNSMIVSPGNSRATTWMKDSSFKVVESSGGAATNLRVACPMLSATSPRNPPTPQQQRHLQVPALPPQTPTTPCAVRGSALYGSFHSSSRNSNCNTPTSEINLWQYDEAAAVAASSPRTTDAVRMISPVDWGTATASPSSSHHNLLSIQQQQQHQDNNITNHHNHRHLAMIPVAPSLKYGVVAPTASGGYRVPSHPTANNNPSASAAALVQANGGCLPPFPPPNNMSKSGLGIHHDEDGIPTAISFVVHSPFDFDVDDDVSLLADDPDDDDENVLPDTTYDVLANTGIFAEDEQHAVQD